MKLFIAALAFLGLMVPALAQSVNGWQSGVFNTGTNATIMAAPADTTQRNYLRKLFCDATTKPAPGVMQMQIRTFQNGTLTTVGFFSVLAGQTDQIEFDPPLWSDTGAAITMVYGTGGGPAKCMWMGFLGQ
jgi:hypothetical protein